MVIVVFQWESIFNLSLKFNFFYGNLSLINNLFYLSIVTYFESRTYEVLFSFINNLFLIDYQYSQELNCLIVLFNCLLPIKDYTESE